MREFAAAFIREFNSRRNCVMKNIDKVFALLSLSTVVQLQPTNKNKTDIESEIQINNWERTMLDRDSKSRTARLTSSAKQSKRSNR